MSTETPQSSDVQSETSLTGESSRTDVGSAFRGYLSRLGSGDLGALPAVLGIVGLVILFTALRPETFLSHNNIANLLVQAMPVTILAMGLVFVLLLGEIDLSAGVTGGVCAAVMAKFLLDSGQPWYVSVLAGLVSGLIIGTVIGGLVSLVRIPSFVVSLAFFLGLQGITLKLIGQGGTVPVHDDVVLALANKQMPLWLGWVLAIVCAVIFTGLRAYRWWRQWGNELGGMSREMLLLRIAGPAVQVLVVDALLLFGAYELNLDRARSAVIFLGGVPWGVPLVAVLLIICTFVLSRTSYGRHIYGVGGNSEAARRAGINVTMIRMSVFMIGSTLAAVSGIVGASRLHSVAPGAGAGNTLLYAVGAAVIGGTSLFGGRGKAYNAILGGLVIAIINNGLGLLGAKAYLNYLITGAFLLVAAGIDALARRRRSASGH